MDILGEIMSSCIYKMNFNIRMRFWLKTSINWQGLMIDPNSSNSNSDFKERIWSQILDLKIFGGCDANVEYRSGPEGVF